MKDSIGWKQIEHGFEKVYVPKLIKATLHWAITGESGYVLSVNKIQFKKHFEDIEEANEVANRYVKTQIQDSEFRQ